MWREAKANFGPGKKTVSSGLYPSFYFVSLRCADDALALSFLLLGCCWIRVCNLNLPVRPGSSAGNLFIGKFTILTRAWICNLSSLDNSVLPALVGMVVDTV